MEEEEEEDGRRVLIWKLEGFCLMVDLGINGDEASGSSITEST
jgi:hypothetical protein